MSGTPAQLVEVYYSADGEDISWTFDARGNRLTETKYEGGASTGNITLAYYANSDLIKTRGPWQFNYDKNENMLSRGNGRGRCDVLSPHGPLGVNAGLFHDHSSQGSLFSFSGGLVVE